MCSLNAKISILRKEMFHPHKKKTGVVLYPYLPIMATSLQWLLSSVCKVAVVERFDSVCQRYMYMHHPGGLPYEKVEDARRKI